MSDQCEHRTFEQYVDSLEPAERERLALSIVSKNKPSKLVDVLFMSCFILVSWKLFDIVAWLVTK